MKRTLGADIGYSSGKNNSNLNVPPSYGDWKRGLKFQLMNTLNKMTDVYNWIFIFHNCSVFILYIKWADEIVHNHN